STEAFARCLKRAAQTANQMIHGYATSHQEYRGMGTTATIAGLLADTLYLAQVGDSRGYLVRDGVAKQITKDQSLMQKLIEAGERDGTHDGGTDASDALVVARRRSARHRADAAGDTAS